MKKAIVLLANGFEEVEALTVVDILRRGGVHCITCSITKELEVLGCHSIHVKANNLLEKTDVNKYDALVVPGGMPGSSNLKDCPQVINLVHKFNNENKLIAAICAGPIVLGKAGILKDKNSTCYPGFEKETDTHIFVNDIVVQHNNIITSPGPATAIYFAFKILENLADKEVVENLKQAMLLTFVEEKILSTKV